MLLRKTKYGAIVRLDSEGISYVRCNYDRSYKEYMLIKESEYQGPGQYPDSAILFLPGSTNVEVERV